MASVTALTDLTVADLWREVKDPVTLWGDVSRETLRAVKLLLQNRMHEELADFLNAGFYTRGGSRCGWRNGHYIRRVLRESQSTWEAFLVNLAARGLTGTALRLITTDGHIGLHAALALVYPHVPRQACWVHVLRNVAQRLRHRDRPPCLAMARRIYQARSRHAAERALQQWRQALQRTAPNAVASLLRDWEALLAFYTVPAADWRRVRTTNAIERAFREIRRRTRPMTCFTNLASCDRIIYAVVHALNLRHSGRPLSWETTQNT